MPFEGSWTPGQLAQHIVLSAGAFVNLLNGPVKETERDPETNVGMLRSTFLNFDTKMKSPDFIVPEQKNYDKQNLTAKLTNIKAGLLDAIQTKDMTKTCTAFELPRSGYITAVEAATFTIVHTKRHVHQLKNIVDKLTSKPGYKFPYRNVFPFFTSSPIPFMIECITSGLRPIIIISG